MAAPAGKDRRREKAPRGALAPRRRWKLRSRGDREARQLRTATRAANWPGIGDRAHCLAYVWRQARAPRAEFLGCSLAPVKKRKAPRLKTPSVRKTAEGCGLAGDREPKNRSLTGRTPDPPRAHCPAARFCAVTTAEYSLQAIPSTRERDLRRNSPLAPESKHPLHPRGAV